MCVIKREYFPPDEHNFIISYLTIDTVVFLMFFFCLCFDVVSCISDWPQSYLFDKNDHELLILLLLPSNWRVRDWIQHFVYVGQTLYQLNYISRYLLLLCFWNNISCYSGQHWTHHVSEIGFELLTPLPPSSKCTNYWQVLPCVPTFQHWGGGDKTSPSSQQAGG